MQLFFLVGCSISWTVEGAALQHLVEKTFAAATVIKLISVLGNETHIEYCYVQVGKDGQ